MGCQERNVPWIPTEGATVGACGKLSWGAGGAGDEERGTCSRCLTGTTSVGLYVVGVFGTLSFRCRALRYYLVFTFRSTYHDVDLVSRAFSHTCNRHLSWDSKDSELLMPLRTISRSPDSSARPSFLAGPMTVHTLLIRIVIWVRASRDLCVWIVVHCWIA